MATTSDPQPVNAPRCGLAAAGRLLGEFPCYNAANQRAKLPRLVAEVSFRHETQRAHTTDEKLWGRFLIGLKMKNAGYLVTPY